MGGVPADQYDRLRRSIGKSDPYELSIALAGLQLMPENAGALPILESAAEFVATLRGPRTRTLRRADLIAVIGAFEVTCDPFEGLFTVSLTPPGVGPTTAFCGRDPRITVRRLGAHGRHLWRPYADGPSVHRMGSSSRRRPASTSSDRRCGSRPGSSEPCSARAVDLVLPVAHAQGGAPPSELLTGPLHHNPFLVTDGELVVALPGSILPTLIELLITRAAALRPQLALRFRAAVRESVRDSLREFGLGGPWDGDRWDALERVVVMTTVL